MSTFEVSDVIRAPARDAWAYAADITRHPDWLNVADSRPTAGDGHAVGDRAMETIRFGPLTWHVELEVVEAAPGRRLRWRSSAGSPVGLDASLEFTDVDDVSCRATYRASVQFRGLWRLLAPLEAMEGRSGLQRELGRLKANLEKGAAPASRSQPL